MGDVPTIGWRSQKNLRGYDSHYRDRRWSTDVELLDDITAFSLMPIVN